MDKFSILAKQFNIDELRTHILKFKKENGCDPFIVCNKDTALYLRSVNRVVASTRIENMGEFSVREVISHTFKFEFEDYIILIDESKNLGDIELR